MKETHIDMRSRSIYHNLIACREIYYLSISLLLILDFEYCSRILKNQTLFLSIANLKRQTCFVIQILHI